MSKEFKGTMVGVWARNLKKRDIDKITLLLRSGLSQTKIAEKFNISQVLVSKINRGVHSIQQLPPKKIPKKGHGICKTCNKQKLLSMFWKNPHMANGHCSSCKVCENIRQNKLRTAERDRKYQQKYRRGIRAIKIIQNEIRSGRIKKGTCWFCGAKEVQGHHLLYSFPKKVIWLCTSHHKKVHTEKSYG